MPPSSHKTVHELFDALDRLKKSKCQSSDFFLLNIC